MTSGYSRKITPIKLCFYKFNARTIRPIYSKKEVSMNFQGSNKTQQGFSQLLDGWEKRSAENSDLVATEIAIHEPDLIKIKALSELYQLPEDEISGHLLHEALEALEAAMPYIPGSTVIRIEEGDEIYEDIGPLPRYLKTQRQLSKNSEK
jgi:hypothetical protein